ncbi:Cobw-domain-containing protein [Thalictrum thalictroides]|uniref:Cobw-domain-containing protein n=1 Tax=Thalictrum thalictroides TaxID=46969 RepID=A0A7J6VPX0_THATH|nr:Cobw-domain-containing protein [Thalictrum thalictroides]
MENDDDEETPPLAILQNAFYSTRNEEDADDSVGVTIITGYLDSGKSTLVNYILNAQHGMKIVVILNEFGDEIGIERAMINEGDGDGGAIVEEWVELANGCVCCTVKKHSLVQALEQLIQRKDRLDHILLETTGLANPAPLASVIWLDDQLESAVKLDSIITGPVVERIMASAVADGKYRFIYLGDGKGDLCPITKLREQDFVMPRKDYPVWDLICSNPLLVKAGVHEWSSWKTNKKFFSISSRQSSLAKNFHRH